MLRLIATGADVHIPDGINPMAIASRFQLNQVWQGTTNRLESLLMSGF
ncbi:MAG: hypothetical protein RMY29_022055 [Nostoc sp. CreGUA01]|nr:hypothetical protein [Nostoc sp. CreGUA01]